MSVEIKKYHWLDGQKVSYAEAAKMMADVLREVRMDTELFGGCIPDELRKSQLILIYDALKAYEMAKEQEAAKFWLSRILFPANVWGKGK